MVFRLGVENWTVLKQKPWSMLVSWSGLSYLVALKGSWEQARPKPLLSLLLAFRAEPEWLWIGTHQAFGGRDSN